MAIIASVPIRIERGVFSRSSSPISQPAAVPRCDTAASTTRTQQGGDAAPAAGASVETLGRRPGYPPHVRRGKLSRWAPLRDATEPMHPLPGQLRIPSHGLTGGMLLRTDANEDELYAFAGAFDGYLVRQVDTGCWIPAFLDDFEGRGLPKLSLTNGEDSAVGGSSGTGDWRRTPDRCGRTSRDLAGDPRE